MAAVVVLSLPAWAGSIRKELAQAADRLEEVLEKNQRSSANCRNNVEPGLNQVLDAIDALAPSDDPQKFDQVANLLSSNLNMAKLSACPEDITRDLTRVAGDLADAASDARRRRPRAGPPPPPQAAGVVFAPAQITEPGGPGAVVTIPSITLNGFQNASVYIAWHWKPETGAWSAWESLPAVGVNSPQFVWNNPYRQVLDYGMLRGSDSAGTGRFLVHAGVFDMNGRELQGFDMPFTAHYPNNAPPPPPGRVFPGRVVADAPPPAPPPARDCGLGLDDPGCNITRGGGQAMLKGEFDGFIASLRANLSESTRGGMVRDTLRTRWLTARQLGAILDLFIGENNKLDAARNAVPRVVDPGNALGFGTRFLSSSRQREFNQLVSAQR